MKDPKHEERLMRALTGDDPQLEGGDAALERELDDLRRIQDELDTVAEQERILADARETPWESGEARIRDLIADATRNGPRKTRTNRWLWLPIAAAAVVTTIVGLDRASSPPTGDQRGPIFLGDELPGAMPSGPVESYAPFQWSKPLPPGWTFELRVYDDTEAGGGVLAEHSGASGSTWSPEVTTESWPESIRWTLDLERPDGTIVDGYVVRAWRSSR
ncbi:MAG: hypothetical protein ACYTFV_11565 [Planctomycetota bacterium]